MEEWMDIQQSANHRTRTTTTTLGYNPENDHFARSPAVLKTFKRALLLQEMLGNDRWYGTMPKECMVVWILHTTVPEEVKAIEEMKAKEK
jgi:hypothetical protein